VVETADIFCSSLEYNKITVKEFIKQACLAIMYKKDQYYPGLGVGVEPEKTPNIKYLYPNQE
jgi:hypothetical protein